MKGFYVLLFIITGITLYAGEIRKEDFTAVNTGTLIESFYLKMLNIGQSENIRTYISCHPHGTGEMFIGNLRLVIYFSEHKSGAAYENELLDINFADMNSDGYKDIIISGRVNYPSGIYENVLFIYTYFPKEKAFHCTLRNASFKLEDGPLSGKDVYESPEKLQKTINSQRNFLKIVSELPQSKKISGIDNDNSKQDLKENKALSDKLLNSLIFNTKEYNLIYILASSDQVTFKRIDIPEIKKYEFYKVVCKNNNEQGNYTFSTATDLMTGNNIEVSGKIDTLNTIIKNSGLKLNDISNLQNYILQILELLYPDNSKIFKTYYDIPEPEANKTIAALIKEPSLTLSAKEAIFIIFTIQNNVLIKRYIKINDNCTFSINNTDCATIKTGKN